MNGMNKTTAGHKQDEMAQTDTVYRDGRKCARLARNL